MKWGAKIMFGLLVASVLFSTAVFGKNLWLQEKEQIKFKNLSNRVAAARKEGSCETEDSKAENQPNRNIISKEKGILPEYQEIAKENQDFAGWLSIEGTNIDYPVMQTPWELEFYLHRNFTGEYSYAGVPFVGSEDFKDGKGDLFVYGHNMRNGTMFADLLKFRSLEDVGVYDTGIILKPDSPLLFLVTCSYRESRSRFVVVGVLKDENLN